MKLTTFGAAGEVTGSCYLVETNAARVLVDFGLHQGTHEERGRNLRLPPIDFASLDAVVLTHAHLDHSGRLPLLAKTGFRGNIYCTPPTRDFCDILLRDSARLQESDAERQTFRNARRGGPPVHPLYTEAEIDAIMPRFQTRPYGETFEVAPGIRVRFSDAGHMLGSASIDMRLEDRAADGSAQVRTIIFSGDIGPTGIPLLRDPEPPIPEPGREVDVVVMESTYGDRDHRSLTDTMEETAGVVREAVWAREKMLVPSFAVGRAQLMVHVLATLVRDGRTPKFPVYLDSPMAIAATQLYRKYLTQLDEIAQSKHGGLSLDLADLRLSESAEDSQRLNKVEGAAVIIAGSGMCSGGRILHHFKHNIWKRDVQILITGYQGHGTLGRQLVEGAKFIKLFGERIAVRAKVHTLGGLSAHAGKSGLIEWAANYRPREKGRPAPRFVLTHGERTPRHALRITLRQGLSFESECPEWGWSTNLLNGRSTPGNAPAHSGTAGGEGRSEPGE